MNKFVVVVLALVLIGLVGCIDVEEHLTLNDDGSGKVAMHYAIAKSYFEQMQAMQDEMMKDLPEEIKAQMPQGSLVDQMFSKDRINEVLAEEASDIELLKYSRGEANESIVWDIEFSFEDINKLYVVYEALSSDESDEEDYNQPQDSGKDERPEKLLTRQDDGTLLFVRAFDDESQAGMGGSEDEYTGGGENYSSEEYPSESAGNDEYQVDADDSAALAMFGTSAEGMQSMAEEMSKKTIRFTVTFPGEIVESNATSVDGNTATWEYKLTEMNDNMPTQRAVIKP
ncbi:MAG: hypothetical protein ACE5FH_08140 [Candidatus Zixiibacteriota bacterium]